MNRRTFFSSLGLGVLAAPLVAKSLPATPSSLLPWIKRSEVLTQVDEWTWKHWDPDSVPYRMASGEVIGFGELKTVYVDAEGYAHKHFVRWRTYGCGGQCRVAMRDLRFGSTRTGKPFTWEELNLSRGSKGRSPL